MNDLNLCQFIGRVGQDPEVRYMPSGGAVVKFSIACGSSWKDKQSGEKMEKTEWVRVTAFGKLGEIIGEYVKKGSLLYISGRIQTTKWQDNSGSDRYTTEIVAGTFQMLGGKPLAPDNQAQGRQGAAPASSKPADEPEPDFEDDVPF